MGTSVPFHGYIQTITYFISVNRGTICPVLGQGLYTGKDNTCKQSLKLHFLTSQKFSNNPSIISCFLYCRENACCGLAVRGLTYTDTALCCERARFTINKVYKTIVTVREKPLPLPRDAICFYVIYCYVYLFHFTPAVQSNVHTVGYDKQGLVCQDCKVKTSCVNNAVYKGETEMAGM